MKEACREVGFPRMITVETFARRDANGGIDHMIEGERDAASS